MALGLDLPDARFAAVVLLILLILTRTAARIAHGPVAAAAAACASAAYRRSAFSRPHPCRPGPQQEPRAMASAAGRTRLDRRGGHQVLANQVGGGMRRYLPPQTSGPRTPCGRLSLVPLVLAFLFGFFAPTAWLIGFVPPPRQHHDRAPSNRPSAGRRRQNDQRARNGACRPCGRGVSWLNQTRWQWPRCCRASPRSARPMGRHPAGPCAVPRRAQPRLLFRSPPT